MLLKGGFFLSVILFGSWEMTQSIIQPILEINLSKTGQLSILLFFLFGSVFTQFISGLSLSVEDGMEYLILSPLLFFSPLLISFIVYFGFWHALPSMAEEFRFLKTKPAFGSFKKFGIQLLPFSLISLLGIAVILFLGLNFLEENQVFLLFFVLISLISFPHILYMDTFLKKNYRY